jgi:hypothetical protein
VQDDLFLRNWVGEKADAAEFSHLLETPVPPYTPLLDSSLPESVYYVEYSTELTVRNRGCWFYLKARRVVGGDSLYIMQTLTHKNTQNSRALMYRASDLSNPCARISIQPLPGRPSVLSCVLTGRPITITMAAGGVTTESPDRTGKTGWTPRRFNYGGRRFVWKQNGSASSTMNEELWEVEKEWPKLGSKTGKVEDKTLGRRLVWHERTSLRRNYNTFHFAGGMGQLFEEYLLASQLARMVVEMQTS